MTTAVAVSKNKNSLTKLFKKTKSRSIVQKIAFSAAMLSIILVLGYAETMTTLGWGFLQVNFSLVFVLATLFYCGKEQTLILMICKLFILPLIASRNNYLAGLANHFLLFTEEGIFIGFIILMAQIKKMPTMVIIILSVLLTSVIIPWIRAAFLQRLFYMAFGMGFSMETAINWYHLPFSQPFYFYIHNYWLGSFATFFLSSLIRFSIAVVILMPIIKIISLKGNNGWGYNKVKNKSKSNK